MKVGKYMSTKVITVSEDTPLPEVWELLNKKHISGIPVVDEKRKLLGYVSKEDILLKMFPTVADLESLERDADEDIDDALEKLKKLKVEKVMSKRVIFTRAESSIMRALSRMMVRKVRQLPVLDEEDHLVGMISKADIFKQLFRR